MNNYRITVNENGITTLELGHDDVIDLKIDIVTEAFEKIFKDGLETIRVSRIS